MLSPTALIVQRHDPARFTTALFAPAEFRESLFTLYAFNHELARAREVASNPMLALIRLQWWREVVEGTQKRHDVATPLAQAIADGRLQPEPLLQMIAAREMEAEDTLPAEARDDYLYQGGGALMAEAGRLLGGAAERDALLRQGAGCAAVGLLRNAAALRAQGRWHAPDGMDGTAMHSLAADLLGAGRPWPRAALPAALPAVIARRWLRRPAGASLGVTGRLAIWAASVSSWC